MSRVRVLWVLVILGLGFGEAIASNQPHPYYGREFYEAVGQGSRDEDLKNLIVTVLRSAHMLKEGEFDEVVPRCSGHGKCYQHTSVGYNRARVFLLGKYYLVKRGNGYAVRDVYCEAEYTRGAGPDRVPDNNEINVEHTWPQSKFSSSFPKDIQKADLHHLYPTDSQMNSSRGNFPFGEVVQDEKRLKCGTARFGRTAEGRGQAFEPPERHKGNVARALFYFGLKYDMQIDKEQESYLRQWHQEDPVDDDEFDRNDEIYRQQGSRNPFIDHPELADAISNF